MSSQTKERSYLFPLYLYPDSDRQDLFAQLEPAGRRPNLNLAVMQALAAAKGKDGLRYEPGEQRVYINASQYFAPVSAEAFSYQVGGYQVCEKWLKDRRERHLEIDDIRTYCRIVTALARTIALQRNIDALYPQVEERVVQIQ